MRYVVTLVLFIAALMAGESADVVKYSKFQKTGVVQGSEYGVADAVVNAGDSVAKTLGAGALIVGTNFHDDMFGYSIGAAYPLVPGVTYLNVTYSLYNNYTYGAKEIEIKQTKGLRCTTTEATKTSEVKQAPAIKQPVTKRQYKTVSLKDDLDTLDVTIMHNVLPLFNHSAVYVEAGIGVNYNSHTDKVGVYAPMGVGLNILFSKRYTFTVGYRHNVEVDKRYIDKEVGVVKLGMIF